MKRRWLIWTAFAALACTPTTFPFGEHSVDVDLAFHETKAVPGTGMTLTFMGVVGDSRCAVDVVCVWAGNAEVEIGTTAAGDFDPSLRTYRLNSFLEPRAFDSGSYHVTLLGVSPEPHEGVPIDSLDYSVKLRIEGR